MKTLTYDEKVLKIAKTLIKEFKAKKDAKYIDIEGQFNSVFGTRHGFFFHYGEKDEMNMGDMGNEHEWTLTYDIAKKIKELLKVGKKTNVILNTKEESTYTGFYQIRNSCISCPDILVITPCKEFLDINKKLTHLGCKPIDIKRWFYGRVSGKRASYSFVEKNYYATDKEMCDKVLAYLKGKKRVSWDIYEDSDLSEREYGIRYETEWSGSIAYKIRFTDANKKDTVIR